MEKLQAVWQLTSTILPSSSVNTMYHDEDKCFQCQELGHMMIMATLQQIAQTKYDHQEYQQDTAITILTQDDVIDPHLRITIKIGTITMTIETDIGLAGLDPIHAVTVAMTHEEVILGPITNPHATAHHATEAQAHTGTDETPHTADPHHAEVFPGIAVDPNHVHHTNTTTKHQQDCLAALTEQPGKPRTGNISRSPLMIHHLSTIALMSRPANQTMI